ncbi:amino acid synthesis family protein [Chachezhania antarctica]|uniref:amino acid synthesis family protein n=1 Tax=Chachezhania antarctica TaxID=2340860 RepID=UPI000EADF9EC|nr:amino acid synthesis family protein [Chachezhania antarctica]|tara:strand:+ start:2539 stop:3084 length:546 start_codon:yes stop_codon:yes gene_type:complete
MQLRKKILLREVVTSDENGTPCTPLTRVAALAVIRNPYAGTDLDEMGELYDFGAALGEYLSAEIHEVLDNPPVTYGKAAIVGTGGAAEHAAAVLHPRMGKPVRAEIGGGRSLMPSTAKVAGPGTTIDLPLGHKDEAWFFDYIDTMTVGIPDAPLADEIVVCLGMSDGTRIRARVGNGPPED